MNISNNHFYLIEYSCECLFIYLWYQNMDCQTCHYFNKMLVTIDFVVNHAQNYFSLFIHIMYTILYHWSNDILHV